MPVHDWMRVEAGIFHDFHHEWITETKRALNRGLRGTGYYALAEQITGNLGPDVLTLDRLVKGTAPAGKAKASRKRGGTALLTSKPKLRFHITTPPTWYANRKKSVTIRHISEHRIVAVLEILSPGNKSSEGGLTYFIRKAQELLGTGIHLSLIDLFPPTRRDPEGIHPLVWGDDDADAFHYDPARPLMCASYIGGPGAEAFVEPVAVGDVLPDLPVYLTPGMYVSVPLEATYQAAFDAVPDFWREVLTTSNA